MNQESAANIPRRAFLRLGLALSASLGLVACGGRTVGRLGRPPAAQELELTPMCDTDPQATPSQTEGPFFKPSSPERRSLIDLGMPGAPFVLTGYVLTSRCEPVPGALLDFWHADSAGAYDNAGYRLRGHQYADEQGRYELETIVPGLYPGRTRHFHVKVQAPNGPILTTQLYFPDEPGNRRDALFRPALLMAVEAVPGGTRGTFTYVVEAPRF
jgi:protocatechuate 3,4-dioxygenase beta subunit